MRGQYILSGRAPPYAHPTLHPLIDDIECAIKELATTGTALDLTRRGLGNTTISDQNDTMHGNIMFFCNRLTNSTTDLVQFFLTPIRTRDLLDNNDTFFTF